MAWTPAQFRSWLAETLKAQLLEAKSNLQSPNH